MSRSAVTAHQGEGGNRSLRRSPDADHRNSPRSGQFSSVSIKYIKQELAPDLLAISRILAPHKDKAKKKAAPK